MATKKRKVDAEDLELDIDVTSNADLDLDALDLDVISDDVVDADVDEEEIIVNAPAPAKKTTGKKNVAPPAAVDISAEIIDPDEDLDYLTLLGYGKNGTGKTTMGATADGSLILAADQGTLSIRNTSHKVKKLICDEWAKVEAAYWLLANGTVTPDGIVIKTKNGPFTVKYVVFDTITKMLQVCLRSVVLGAAATDTTKDVVNPTLRDWGTMTQKLSYWLMQFKELPVHLVWLVQETSTGEVGDDEFSIFPDVNKALRSFLLAEADIIGRLCIIKHEGKMEYAMRFGANNQYVTKDRTGMLKGTMLNPQLDKIFARALS